MQMLLEAHGLSARDNVAGEDTLYEVSTTLGVSTMGAGLTPWRMVEQWHRLPNHRGALQR
jgi:hypothetical protein